MKDTQEQLIHPGPQPDSITVDVAREADVVAEWAVIRVHDHGLGIPAAELGRVFDRFYRGSNVAGEIRGVGIGLSGSRQIVEQHGGRISVESQEGVGSTFTVRLPLGPAGTWAGPTSDPRSMVPCGCPMLDRSVDA